MTTIKDLPRLATAALTFVGAFTRFTHGRYTPSFYTYQLDHAPDNESTRYIPLLDTVVAAMLLLPQTRVIATFVCAFFLAIGVAMQVQKKGKYILHGSLTLVTALAACWLTWK